LARKYRALLAIYRFNNFEEAQNGADWEWWMGSRRRGWICLRFQAKKLKDGVYREIGHRLQGGRRQYDVLIDSAARDEQKLSAPIWPLYCFYNGWLGSSGTEPTWPERLSSSQGCPDGHVPPNCSHAQLADYGCAVAPAAHVAISHQLSAQPLNLETHLAYSRPWSQLIASANGVDHGTRQHDADNLVYYVQRNVKHWSYETEPMFQERNRTLARRYTGNAERRSTPGEELPSYADALLRRRPDFTDEWPESTIVSVLNLSPFEE
jgi:hypothetical protein